MTGRNFRLPTEAEWEYAARGGKSSKGFKFAGDYDIESVAWYSDNCLGETHDVATKQPNELGIYDMTGNIWEWCNDWYGYYSSESQTNPQGPERGRARIIRGGSWGFLPKDCRVSKRASHFPNTKEFLVGLRLVLTDK
jgi:formylglycine-generating enzyme required for sulfatase activity